MCLPATLQMTENGNYDIFRVMFCRKLYQQFVLCSLVITCVLIVFKKTN